MEILFPIFKKILKINMSLEFKIDNGNNGILPPTKTSVQKNAITPSTALMLYDTDLCSYNKYNTSINGNYRFNMITNIVLTSNVVTLTVANGNMTAGQTGYIYNLGNASFSFANGTSFTASTANSTTITYALVRADQGTEVVTQGYVLYQSIITSSPAWSSFLSSCRQIACHNCQTTQQWTSSGTATVSGGLYLYTNPPATNSTLTWTLPVSVDIGAYVLFYASGLNADIGDYNVQISQNGGAYTTIIYGVSSWASVASGSLQQLNFFTINTAGTLAIRWQTAGKNSASTNYYVPIIRPQVLLLT